MRIISLIATLALITAPSALYAQAKPGVAVTSKIQVVKVVTDAKGEKKNVLKDVANAIPGDPLVIWVYFKNGGAAPATSFVINNPVNPSIEFTGFGDNSGWALVSVDGGKTFGTLAALKVQKSDKTFRAAAFADVTNVRWAFPRPIVAAAGGTLSFYGIVK